MLICCSPRKVQGAHGRFQVQRTPLFLATRQPSSLSLRVDGRERRGTELGGTVLVRGRPRSKAVDLCALDCESGADILDTQQHVVRER